MAEYTDLALELADLCDQLNVQTGEAGDVFLANTFGVEPWSPEFFQVVFSIVNRTTALEALIKVTKANPAVVAGASGHLAQIRRAFDKHAMSAAWHTRGRTFVAPEHSSPVRMLSAALSADAQYPKLTPKETEELKGLVSQLVDWLKGIQLSEKDFVRESLIEGLQNFLFRLERLSWFGWGYSIESLRDVILAYLTLERGLKPQQNPDAAAVLKKVGAVLKKVAGYTSKTKEAADTTDWLLTCYRTIVTVGSSGAGGFIAGLIAN